MSTIYDYLSVLIFVAAATTFFVRLRSEDAPLWPYVGVSVGCAFANWLGNEGYGVAGFTVLTGCAFGLYMLASAPLKDNRG